MKKQLGRAFWIALASLAAAVVFWSADADRGVTVRTVEVVKADPHSSISTNGRVEAARVHELRAPMSGFARSIAVREGESLRAGQTVLVLATPALESELAAARSELAAAELDAANTERGPAPEEINAAEADVARLRLEVEAARKALATSAWLLERKAVVAAEVEEGKQTVARAEQALAAAVQRRADLGRRFGEPDFRRVRSRVEAARARVGYLAAGFARAVVRAPAAGTLYQFDLKDGTYLNAGDLVGMLADLGDLRVRAFVDEPELGRVRPGSEVQVRWDARAGQSWRGTVIRMPSQIVARGSRSVGEVLCSITSEAGALIPNVNVDVEIATASGAAVPALPRGAVLQDAAGQYCWVVRDKRVARHAVETGRSSASLIEITRGLQVGDRVIQPGDAVLAEGTKVRAASP